MQKIVKEGPTRLTAVSKQGQPLLKSLVRRPQIGHDNSPETQRWRLALIAVRDGSVHSWPGILFRFWLEV